MNLEIMVHHRDIRHYRAIDNLLLGIDKNGNLDRLELYLSVVGGERVTVVFEQETIRAIESIKKDGEEIYRK